MKNSYTGKTLFVPKYCVEEIEKLIAKRREQHLIKSLDGIYREKKNESALKMKAVIDATTEQEINLEDCEEMIKRGKSVIPMLSRSVMPYGRIVYRHDYLGIYKWYIGGEKKPIDN